MKQQGQSSKSTKNQQLKTNSISMKKSENNKVGTVQISNVPSSQGREFQKDHKVQGVNKSSEKSGQGQTQLDVVQEQKKEQNSFSVIGQEDSSKSDNQLTMIQNKETKKNEPLKSSATPATKKVPPPLEQDLTKLVKFNKYLKKMNRSLQDLKLDPLQKKLICLLQAKRYGQMKALAMFKVSRDELNKKNKEKKPETSFSVIAEGETSLSVLLPKPAQVSGVQTSQLQIIQEGQKSSFIQAQQSSVSMLNDSKNIGQNESDASLLE